MPKAMVYFSCHNSHFSLFDYNSPLHTMKKILLLSLLSVLFVRSYAQQITFTPQWTPQSQFAGYYAALENGYYAEAGLDVTIKHPTASYSSMNMLKDGRADVITAELIRARWPTLQGTA